MFEWWASVDWDATASMLQGWATLVGAGAVVYAAKRGADTFDNFRKQKIGQKRIEAAERILNAAYKGRKALRQVRSPLMGGQELARAEKMLREQPDEWGQRTEKERKNLAYLQAYYNRLERTLPEQTELDECLPIARAFFGEAAEKAIETLNHQFWSVQVDVESYVDDKGDDPEFSQKVRRGIWEGAPTGQINETSVLIDNSIAQIELICLPLLTP